MAANDQIVTALAQMEERLVERMDDSLREFRRDIQLDMNGALDGVQKRLDRLIEGRLPSE